MFQDFDSPSEKSHIAERVKRLRAEMASRRLDAFIVPRADEHQGEYVPPSAERLRWITGFTGSAGFAVIARRSACLFVDGRYTLQAPQQVDTAVFTVRQFPEQKLSDWLIEELPSSATVGFDPWLHTAAEIGRLKEATAKRQLVLKPVPSSPLDKAWGKDRPRPPGGAVIVHPLKYAGTPADQKAKPELFIASAKLDEAASAHLAPLVRIQPPKELTNRLAALRTAKRKVRLDADTAAFAIARALGKSSLVPARDPCIALKAKKCSAEIKGSRAAHLRDGAAVVRFLAWLDGAAASRRIDEIEAVRQLEQFRRTSPLLRDISFDTISGSGPNGAIVHYRVTEASNRKLGAGELFLIDSGAQYADGTTDITRTVAIGTPTEEMRRRYTAVLKGHVAISTARFPSGSRGVDLDPLARHALWSMGLDYDHGTGHGVGSYLSVHEGPASISKRGMVALEPGMILSNEPGYYKTGAYGIRIENLVLVEPAKVPPGGERAMLSFETLTLAPYDRRLIATADLTAAERTWIDTYHARVAAEVGEHLDDAAAREWLTDACAPL